MKKHLVLSLAGLMSVAGLALGQQKKQPGLATAQLQLAQCALKVSGMKCGGCAETVKQGLLRVHGVKAAKVDFKTSNVEVEYDSRKTTPEKIVGAFNQSNPGYRAELTRPQPRKD